jgi:hypothetical protein
MRWTLRAGRGRERIPYRRLVRNNHLLSPPTLERDVEPVHLRASNEREGRDGDDDGGYRGP